MRVSPIHAGIVFKGNSKPDNKTKFNKYSMIPLTGYTSLGCGVASGVLGYTKKFKSHKITAAIALVAAVAHIVLLKTMHHFNKPKEKLI